MNEENWKKRITESVQNDDTNSLDVFAKMLEEAEQAKQELRNKGYGWTGLGLLETVKNEVPNNTTGNTIVKGHCPNCSMDFDLNSVHVCYQEGLAVPAAHFNTSPSTVPNAVPATAPFVVENPAEASDLITQRCKSCAHWEKQEDLSDLKDYGKCQLLSGQMIENGTEFMGKMYPKEEYPDMEKTGIESYPYCDHDGAGFSYITKNWFSCVGFKAKES